MYIISDLQETIKRLKVSTLFQFPFVREKKKTCSLVGSSKTTKVVKVKLKFS